MSISQGHSRTARLLWIVGVFLVVFVVVEYAIPPATSVYAFYHRRGEVAVWQSTEFRFPAPWYRRLYNFADGRAVFLRDQLPWSQGRGMPFANTRSLAIVELLPADSDFAQAPDVDLTRWEQSYRAFASRTDFQNSEFTLTTSRNAKEEFRCGNVVMRGHNENVYLAMDCINVRDGWRFVYEGLRDYAPEARSILTQSH